MVYKLGKKSGQLSTKLGKIGTLHIVSIDTASAPRINLLSIKYNN